MLVSLKSTFTQKDQGADLGNQKKLTQPSTYYTESKSHILERNKVHLVFLMIKEKTILYPEHFNIHLNIKESNEVYHI